MTTLLGIDLGTQSVKAMLLNSKTGESYTSSQNYPVDIPQQGWAEQALHQWWDATVKVLLELKQQHPQAFSSIKGIGFSGQMHGLVCMDKDNAPLRPAIIWLDKRSIKQVNDLNNRFGTDGLEQYIQNPVFAGSALASLLWMRDNESDLLAQTKTILLPKDYLRYRLTGMLGTDYSDASGTAAFSTKKREWANELITACGLNPAIFPACYNSTQTAGYVTATASLQTGLAEGLPVVYGAGDQPCQSIGNGAIQENTLIANIGTGGQVAALLNHEHHDPKLRTQTFCHAIPGKYTILGATLNAGMALNWFANNIISRHDYKALDKEAQNIPAGSEGLLFLPYLSGERTPYMDPSARGMFFGLDLAHTQAHFTRAVMEGVAYGLRDALTVFEQLGISAKKMIASGGGATSPLWLQIQADILKKEVFVCTVAEQACLGACLIAGVGTHLFGSFEQACEQFVFFKQKSYTPILQNAAAYQKGYSIYQKLYPANAPLMVEIDAPLTHAKED